MADLEGIAWGDNLCDTCSQAGYSCPVWSPSHETEECVEYTSCIVESVVEIKQSFPSMGPVSTVQLRGGILNERYKDRYH